MSYPSENTTDSCIWSQDSSYCYAAQCGKVFVFNDDGAEENGFKFCPFCGKRLVDIKYKEEEE